ncbi:MAG TPA: peptidylprolyl isomerase [Thermoanaerobaculia bacterium]|nr:peptidylprolyl isomerase [Thermoanaerobaculia bacterium]
MKRIVLLFACLLATPLLAGERQVLSDVYNIVKKYKSMEGPAGMQTIYLGDKSDPELLWLTAIKTEVVGEDGKTLMSPELMCHMNVDIDPVKHRALFNLKRLPAARLMTISQGMRVPGGGFAARLPEGFAFPIASNEPLLVMTQVLNHNIEHPNNLNVRHRVTFEYVRDRDLTKRPIPLFNLPVTGMVQMADNPLAITSAMASDPAGHTGASCIVAMRAPNAAGMASDYVDPHGKHMTGHWVVPPGKQVNSSDATWFMNLPYDSKLHYGAVHLHPFAQSLTLRDATAGTDIIKAQAVNPKKGVGLDRVDSFISVDGVPMYKDHKYEMISVYNNPTRQNADSMASMFLALDDPEFLVPTRAELLSRGTIITDGSAVIVRTSEGDFGAMLMNRQVPATVLAFARLVSTGAFSGTDAKVTDSTITFTAPLNDEFRRLMHASAVEQKGLHVAGALSLCATADAVSFVIVTVSSPDLDKRCTVFAQVGPGAEVLRAISATGSAQLLRGEILSGPELNDLKLAPAKKIASR